MSRMVQHVSLVRELHKGEERELEELKVPGNSDILSHTVAICTW